MKSSPTKGGWFKRLKEAVNRLPDGPINHIEPGTPIPIGIKRPGEPFFIGTAADLGVGDELTQLEALRQENAKLLAANEDLRHQLIGAKANERKMAWRIEAFRKKWPAIHKDFFTAKGKNNEL